MLRHRTFQRSMSRLAFLAVLLMAFAPAISRWTQGDSLQQLVPGLTGICTAAGLKSVDVAAWLGGGSTSTSTSTSIGKVPAPDHFGMDADCAYCTLLAGTALLLLTLALLFPRVLANLVPASLPLSFRSSSVFPGLGSRGPPLAL
ncbi:hypothetical protein CSC74_13020 [Pseudoxanthomonas yeongjuensis]|uniref:DUF2946 family protein n=1 Tax=Pseudoxanthomonas yeongjuensis TaxID=377616 RepID=UPI0013913841|nr:DUF2946 family protein [Pseudoxanthomonas yeongjuensis]KAF1715492.1 hypothetical protein CSC74_13020 [Pseudoxanthomonas yeongjuensis]